jgi:predicted ATPase/class 3 adenylate cyclase
MAALPDGTVTFLFSDVEGSTQLLERHGDLMGRALGRHHELFEQIIERHDGVIFETVGDAVYAAFSRPSGAIAASLDAHRALAAEPWGPIERIAVRIAVNTGPVERRGRNYFGAALFRASRLQALGYGEQTLVAGVTATLATGRLPDGAVLRDLGFHQLKDLGEPEHVFQLDHPDLRREFPPLKALDARRHNLPEQLSSFVGRDRELGEIGRLLDARRLVTLLGPGGIGKTRLALQVAADRFDAHADGVWFVDLAPIDDASTMPGAVARALGLPGDIGEEVTDRLRTFLAESDLLLVLDNLEQIRIAAAPIISGWLRSASRIRVLATSRAPLRVQGEQEFVVPPLTAGNPSVKEAQPAPAVQLFTERAQAIVPGFDADMAAGPLIADICMRLDGLPLAIELAAARLRLFALPELHRRLADRLPLLGGGSRDLPARQQTLQATIAWSEALLGNPARTLFRRLGVFPGTFAYEAAEAVADALDRQAVPELLSELLEQSLIRARPDSVPTRYQMLETVREYALARLREDDQVDVATEHAFEYVGPLCGEHGPRVIGGGQTVALARLDDELENVRLVLAWLRDRHDGLRLGVMVANMARYWQYRGLRHEGSDWVAAARAMVPDDSDRLGADLVAAAGLLVSDEDPVQSAALAREAADRYRALGLDVERGRTLSSLAGELQKLHRWDELERVATEAITISERVGDRRTQAVASGNLAIGAMAQGKYETAQARLVDAVELMRLVGDEHDVVIGLGNLAALALQHGDLVVAERYARDAADTARSLGFVGLEGWALTGQAEVMVQDGRVTDAARTMEAGLDLLAKVRDLESLVREIDHSGVILAAAGDLIGAAATWATAARLASRLRIALDASNVRDQAVKDVRAKLGRSAADAAAKQDQALGIDAACDVVRGRLRAVAIAAQAPEIAPVSLS